LVEHLICNQEVAGSSPIASPTEKQMTKEIKNLEKLLDLEETKYGFKWGITHIERCASVQGHIVIAIRTPKEILHVRVTPTGLIRIDKDVAKVKED
jgi:hypothetical protein